jgi:predicted adenine nucleotide alpha hydrolase (AANH) superfamily ATPase
MTSSEPPVNSRTDRGPKNKQKLLLHVCCAPCSTHPIELLRSDFQVAAFYYNPNIFPPQEYQRRLDEVTRLCGRLDVELHVGPYDEQIWSGRMRGRHQDREGGPHCAVCFWIRLWRTAREARRRRFDYFASTLTVSPHKEADVINRMGERAARRAGVRFRAADFKKGDGFRHSYLLSQEYGLYRQDYCGCADSLREREKRGEKWSKAAGPGSRRSE